MLKPQDCLVLIKLLANPAVYYSQRQLSDEICISLSEVNAGLKRLEEAGLVRKGHSSHLSISKEYIPNLTASLEFLTVAIKYFFPVKLGTLTRGIPTAVAAPIFQNKIALGRDPVPVWPDAQGDKKGLGLDPIHPSVTKSLHKEFDENFYEILVLVDAIRVGRARERNIAKELLSKKISGKHNELSQTRESNQA